MDGATPTGLYAPGFERDSCGFGLIADLDDRPDRGLAFLPDDERDAVFARAMLTSALAIQRLDVAGWRVVPVDRDACGPMRKNHWLASSASTWPAFPQRRSATR